VDFAGMAGHVGDEPAGSCRRWGTHGGERGDSVIHWIVVRSATAFRVEAPLFKGRNARAYRVACASKGITLAA
jgi:hypothetical protein